MRWPMAIYNIVMCMGWPIPMAMARRGRARCGHTARPHTGHPISDIARCEGQHTVRTSGSGVVCHVILGEFLSNSYYLILCSRFRERRATRHSAPGS